MRAKMSDRTAREAVEFIRTATPQQVNARFLDVLWSQEPHDAFDVYAALDKRAAEDSAFEPIWQKAVKVEIRTTAGVAKGWDRDKAREVAREVWSRA